MRISDGSSDVCSSDLMARRRLLTGDERRRLFDPPVQETAIIGHYTLSAEDVELVGRRYGPANRLGLAAQIALMRHPGFGLQPEIGLPDVILQYLAAQLFVDPSSFSAYGQRAQTRTDHRSEEHTSELQSLMRISYAVFCLKTKTQSQNIITYL